MQSKLRNLVIAVLLGLTSLPLVVMLISLVLDTVTTTQPFRTSAVTTTSR